ncbi:HD domain-containing protein [bacterium]|nr:HD domain-containing protein [bacterium]
MTPISRALVRAESLHRGQFRRSSRVPYVAHLWGVASLVAEMAGSEIEIIAALLHDAVEDQGGLPTLRAIEVEFGPEVARIVMACSDTTETPKPPWRSRKEAYLARLRVEDDSVAKVSLADKIHNARALLMELREEGPVAFEKFNGKKEGTLWYYREVSSILLARQEGPWERELARIVQELQQASETSS